MSRPTTLRLDDIVAGLQGRAQPSHVCLQEAIRELARVDPYVEVTRRLLLRDQDQRDEHPNVRRLSSYRGRDLLG